MTSFCGAAALWRVGQLINLNRKVLVVTDSGVPQQYLKTVLAQCRHGRARGVAAGRGDQEHGLLRALLTMMLEHGFGRTDAVLALGRRRGGRRWRALRRPCYMRGVDFINCPTTTLAQIDSSIGGKTAVNLAGTKNIVGAFHQPRLVVADPDTLAKPAPRAISSTGWQRP